VASEIARCPRTKWWRMVPPEGRSHGLVYNGAGFIVGDAELPGRIDLVGQEVRCRFWEAWCPDDLWMSVGAEHKRVVPIMETTSPK